MTGDDPHPPRLCPTGCGPMHQFTFRSVTLDTCSACAGIWFDGREYGNLGRLSEDAFHTLEGLARPTATLSPRRDGRQCPTCAVRLIPLPVRQGDAQVQLDQCPHCEGIWADDQELEALSQTLQANKPSFVADMPASVRGDIAFAVAQEAIPAETQRVHLFQSLVVWLHRPR